MAAPAHPKRKPTSLYRNRSLRTGLRNRLCGDLTDSRYIPRPLTDPSYFSEARSNLFSRSPSFCPESSSRAVSTAARTDSRVGHLNTSFPGSPHLQNGRGLDSMTRKRPRQSGQGALQARAALPSASSWMDQSYGLLPGKREKWLAHKRVRLSQCRLMVFFLFGRGSILTEDHVADRVKQGQYPD